MPKDVGFNYKFNEARNYLGKDEIDAILNSMRESPNHYTILDGNVESHHFFVDAKETIDNDGKMVLSVKIYIDLDHAIAFDDNNIASPAFGAYHEFIHALRTVTDWKGYYNDTKEEDSDYDNKEEKRVITEYEHKKADELKEPKRYNHKDNGYKKVDNPTFHITDGEVFPERTY